MADHHPQEIIDDQETSEISKPEEHPVSQTEQKQENPSIAKIKSKGTVEEVIKRSKKTVEESDLPDAYKGDRHLSGFPISPNELISLSSGSRSNSSISSSDEGNNNRIRFVGLSLEMVPRLVDFKESLEMMMMKSSEMADKTQSERESILMEVDDMIEALDEAEIEDYRLKEKLEKKEKKVEKFSSKLEEVRQKNSWLKEQLDDMIKKKNTNTAINKAENFHKPHRQIDQFDEKSIKSEVEPISPKEFMGTAPYSNLSPPSSDESSSSTGSNSDGGNRKLVFCYDVMKQILLGFKGMQEMDRKMEEIDDMLNLLGEAEDTDKDRQEEIEKNRRIVRMLRFELKQERLMTSRLELQLDVMRMKIMNKQEEQRSWPNIGEVVVGDCSTVEHSAKRGDADEGHNEMEQPSPTGAGEHDDDDDDERV